MAQSIETMGKYLVTHERMVEAAIWVFARKGFENGSIPLIAKKARVSPSAIFHHFRNKDEIVEAALVRIATDNHKIVESLLRPEDDARAQLKAHFSGNIEWALQHPDQAQLLILIYHLACFHPGFRDRYISLLSSARARISRYVHAAQREGKLRSNDSLEGQVRLLHDCVVGTFVNTLAADLSKRDEVADLKKDIEDRWESLLNAIFIS
jgi:AcrR family transcriptional regulator